MGMHKLVPSALPSDKKTFSNRYWDGDRQWDDTESHEEVEPSSFCSAVTSLRHTFLEENGLHKEEHFFFYFFEGIPIIKSCKTVLIM